MFVGHYAAAYALKGKETNTSLGMLFAATQFIDILFFPLATLGVEKITFVEGFTEVNNFQMEYPITHGLLGSLLWALMFYILYRFVIAKGKPNAKRIAIIMGLAVLSHWFVDLIVHTPDLPLIAGDPKFGIGLWHNKIASFAVESLLLIIAFVYYMKNTKGPSKMNDYLNIAFLLFMLFANYLNFYILPANEDVLQLTISALFFYFLFAGFAHLLDRRRLGI
ncbi:MAG: hypothetical protein P8M34_15820 [Saprospiraceae bacterium]|nr:hypothetical protein [Saprospiraceae bacterium]|tara:strand:- start:784 stop:1449 length:666 start_codon:yes stop_codon:yes gene_type:complete